MQQNELYVPPFLRDLMKGATEEDIRQASENLRGYVQALYATFRRMQAEQVHSDSADPETRARFQVGGTATDV